MVTTAELQRRGLRYAVSVDAAATNASLLDLQQKGLPYAVEVADGATRASRAALEARGLAYFVPVLVDATPASKASLAQQGLRYAVKVDANILPADRATLERQGLRYFVAVDSSGNSVSAVAGGGAALLTGETDGFATDFTYATDASRVAVKTAEATTSYALDAFYGNAGTSPKQVYDIVGNLVWSPHNTLLRSEDFTNAAWTKIGTPVVTAHTIQDDDPAAVEYITQSVTGIIGAQFTVTAWFLKDAVTSRFPSMMVLCTANRMVQLNTSTGAITTLTSALAGSSVVVDAGAYWQLSITIIPDTPTIATRIYPAYGTVFGGAVDVAAVGTVTIDKTQVCRGPVPTAYLPTTAAIRNGLAVDYDPVTHAALGLLCEPAATNLLLNNAALSTQSATVTAVPHTLSFFGTGTVTLTGVSTAGPLTGTGANNRVSLTFTPTAGSLTLTVTGTVSRAQLEATVAATSQIPTFGATVTRATDQYNITPASINYSATAGSWWCENYMLSATGNARLIGTNVTAAALFYNSAAYQMNDTTNLAQLYGSMLNNINRAMSAFQSGDRAVTVAGLAPATDAGVVTNLLGATTIYFGNGAATPSHGYIRKNRYLPRRPSGAEMQSMTT